MINFLKNFWLNQKQSIFFLGITIFLYGYLFFQHSQIFSESFHYFFSLFFSLLPILFLIVVLMTITLLLFENEKIKQSLVKKDGKKWVFAIIGGIISTGPLYIWFPFLADLEKKGVSYGIISCFIYNRAIKIPLMPVAIAYFGIKYVIILTLTMILFSLLQGKILSFLTRE
jgi:uncharacterized membrane protein YraQ (UPF0718 family)